ncbi:MAG: hypothetical protein ACRDNS_06355, partial [Trebonia sp.]
LRAGAASADQTRYEITYTGLLFIKRTDSGQESNGSDCQLSADDLHAPFQSQYSLKLAFDSDYRFAFNPSGRHAGTVIAKSTSVHGSHFSYSGSFYGQGCNKISYGPGGKPCTGTLSNHGKGYLFARFTRARRNEDMKFVVGPFGAITAAPPACNDDDSPPNSHDAESEMDLGLLSQAFAFHAYSTVERITHGVSKTIPIKLDRSRNCSQQADDGSGDTDTCRMTVIGNGALVIHPLG